MFRQVRLRLDLERCRVCRRCRAAQVCKVQALVRLDPDEPPHPPGASRKPPPAGYAHYAHRTRTGDNHDGTQNAAVRPPDWRCEGAGWWQNAVPPPTRTP